MLPSIGALGLRQNGFWSLATRAASGFGPLQCPIAAVTRSEKQKRLARHDQRGGAAEDDRLARQFSRRDVGEGRVDEGDGAGHVRAMRPDLLTLRKGVAWRGLFARKAAKTQRGRVCLKLPPSRTVIRIRRPRTKRTSSRLCGFA